MMIRLKDINKIGNYSLLQVEGDSMYPLIKNGDLIAIDRRVNNKYNVGDVVSFIADEQGTIITHKIVEIKEDDQGYHYFTRGVNNNYQDNDYIEIKQIIGEYKGFRIPLLGYVIRFSNTIIGYSLLVILPLGVLFVLIVKELLKEILKRGED